MLVLLPPSESKATGGRGRALDLAGLSFPALTPVREQLLTALVRLAVEEPAALARALGIPAGRQADVERDAGLRGARGLPGRPDAVERDAALLTAPTLPALRLYTGVVYEHLGYDSLSPAGLRRADRSLVVASALFGLLRPADRVPSYRLSGASRLPGIGGLPALWQPVLEPLLAAQRGLVVDLRSSAYGQLARVPGAVQVRVLREVDGRRSTVSHDNKWTKGRLARALCEQGARTVGDVAEAGRSLADAVDVDGRRVDLVLHGLASAR